MDTPQQTIARLTSELMSNHAGRLGVAIAQPNIQHEVLAKRRPTHMVNISKVSGGGVLSGGTAGNTYTIQGTLPVGFEYKRAVIDGDDSQFWGLVNVQIEKYDSNAGKAAEAQNPGPLSAIDTWLDRADTWAPAGMLDKQVGTTDLTLVITLYCWKTTTDPFHGVTLLGVDHSNKCPLEQRVTPLDKVFRVLPSLKRMQLDPKNLVASLGQHAQSIFGNMANALAPGKVAR